MIFARTVVIPADGDAFLQWQTAEPSDALDYVLDATAAIPGDLIAALSVSIFPSGSGEMTVSAVSAVLNVATIRLSGGVAGRLYSIRVDATTQLGRLYSWVVYLPVMDPRSNIAPPPAPVANFGAAVVWVYSGPVRPLPAIPILPNVTYPASHDARLVKVPADGNAFLQWPAAETSASLDYQLDLTAALPGDLISSVSVSCAPSGSGEVVLSNVSATDTVAKVTLTGGVSGRVYSVRFDVVTQVGRTLSLVVDLHVTGEFPSAPPPSPFFGAAQTWTYSGPARPLPTVPVLPTNPWPLTDDARLITIPLNGKTYLQWPVAEVSDFLDYKLDVTAPVIQNGDEISSILLSIAPSGSGELSASYLRSDGGVIKANLSQGLPGRLYRVRIDVNTLLGRDFSWVVNLPIDANYGVYSVNPPTDPGFGPASQWALMVLQNSQGFWRLENNLGNWAWG